MRQPRPRLLCVSLGGAVALALAAAVQAAGPSPANPSFEQDGYRQTPGYARVNGGVIAGWQTSGGAGANPVWRDPGKRVGPESPFHDNGRVPDGRQVAFIQGPGSLRQSVPGFRQGFRYRVVYRENARVQRQGDEWPRAQVRLGGQVVVSPHSVTPVTRADDFEVPFCRVESAWFTAPADGPCDLVLETVQASGTTTLLLDDVRLEEAPPGP